MERFPQELAHAFTGVFPQGDPYTSVWDQSEVSALERSADEDQHSDSAAMSAMYALMKTYGGLERCLGHLSGSLLTVRMRSASCSVSSTLRLRGCRQSWPV